MSEFLVPYQTLTVGSEIYFKYFPDAPIEDLPKIRSGVVASIEVQVGILLDGKTTVQTLLGLTSLSKWLAGEEKVVWSVALEFMESVAIESFHPPKASPKKYPGEDVRDLAPAPKKSGRLLYAEIFDLYRGQGFETPTKLKLGKKSQKASENHDRGQDVPEFYVTTSRR